MDVDSTPEIFSLLVPEGPWLSLVKRRFGAPSTISGYQFPSQPGWIHVNDTFVRGWAFKTIPLRVNSSHKRKHGRTLPLYLFFPSFPAIRLGIWNVSGVSSISRCNESELFLGRLRFLAYFPHLSKEWLGLSICVLDQQRKPLFKGQTIWCGQDFYILNILISDARDGDTCKSCDVLIPGISLFLSGLAEKFPYHKLPLIYIDPWAFVMFAYNGTLNTLLDMEHLGYFDL